MSTWWRHEKEKSKENKIKKLKTSRNKNKKIPLILILGHGIRCHAVLRPTMSTRVPPPGRLKNLQVMAITRGGLIAGASSDARVDSLLGTTIEVPFVPHMWVPSWERAVRVYRRHGAFRWLWRRGWVSNHWAQRSQQAPSLQLVEKDGCFLVLHGDIRAHTHQISYCRYIRPPCAEFRRLWWYVHTVKPLCMQPLISIHQLGLPHRDCVAMN